MSTSQGFILLKKKNVNGESKWFEDGDEENDGKYVGKIENGKPNGHGTLTSPDGNKYVGEWKNGKEWNLTSYDKYGNILGKWVNGEQMTNSPQKTNPIISCG